MPNTNADQPPVRLTRRERDILTLIAQGMTNGEIAEQLVMSPQTIRWYVKELYSKFDVHSRDDAIAAAQAYGKTPAAPPEIAHNLPAQITTFVGREREINVIRESLLNPDIRLLTLVGTAGMGKTRLCIEAAYTLLDAFPDGVTFIALAPINDADSVAHAAAQALGIQEGDADNLPALKETLRRKQTLLIFDNFEHVLDAAMLVSDLLASTPTIKVLATSREPLRLYGEQHYAVPPMSLSADASSEAATLFIQRARAVNPAFMPTTTDKQVIGMLCARLDGIPLAIELAAARLILYPPQAMLDRLDKRLKLLTNGSRDMAERHRTLRAAIDWSYQLLNEDEKRLFRRLGIFTGGWTLEALEAVGSPGLTGDVYDVFDSLIAKSLIHVAEGDYPEPRFLMLETLREFALEQLDASGERQSAQEAQGDFFLRMALLTGGYQRNQAGQVLLDRLDADMGNLRAALDFFDASGAVEQEFTMVGALSQFWWERSHLNEMLTRAQTAIQHEREKISPELRAGVYIALGHGQGGLYRNSEAIQAYETALELARQSDNKRLIVRALQGIVSSNPEAGNVAQMIQLMEEALALTEQIQDHHLRLLILLQMEIAMWKIDDSRRAMAMLEEIITLAHQLEDDYGLTYALQHRSVGYNMAGDYENSLASAIEGLEYAWRIDHKRLIFALINQQGEAELSLKRGGDALITAQTMLEFARIANIPADITIAYGFAALASQLNGDTSAARQALRKALEVGRQVDSQDFKLDEIVMFGILFTQMDEHTIAAQIYGMLQQTCVDTEVDLSRYFTESANTHLAITQKALGNAVFEDNVVEGAALTVDQAWAKALAVIR